MKDELDVVTGAMSFSGRCIAQRLLQQGRGVRTFTGHPDRTPPGSEIEVLPYHFDDYDALVRSFEGAGTFYNTYWIRFEYREMTFRDAVENSKLLIRAAQEAGVRRIVHMSIAHPSLESRFAYYAGKAAVEEAIGRSTMSHAILRPTVMFGAGDILLNNIAWHLRHFPVFAIFGDGQYKIQPVYVEDVADLAVAAGQRTDNSVIDAAGPDIFVYEDMIRLLADKLHASPRLAHLSPTRAMWLTRLSGTMFSDVVITRDEMDALMEGLLVSHEPPRGTMHLADYLDRNADHVGVEYISEVRRHYSPWSRVAA